MVPAARFDPKTLTTDGHRWTQMLLEDDAFPLQPRVLEVEDQANSQFGDTQVVEHLAALNICNAVDDLCIHDHLIEGNQIGDEQPYPFILVEHLELALLAEADASQAKLNHQRIFVALLVQPVAQFIKHFKRAPNDRVGFLFEQESSIISTLQVWL